jgi:hypothetical protein
MTAPRVVFSIASDSDREQVRRSCRARESPSPYTNPAFFICRYALHASCTAPLVIDAFKAAVVSVEALEEVLTDNGPQYVTWRGTSRFASELQRRGIKHIVATPRRPQTLVKVERFLGTLWREWFDSAVFLDLADAQKRAGYFIDYYNFQRPHQGIDGLAPADRFFGAAPQMLATLKARVQGNALELARSGSRPASGASGELHQGTARPG